MRRHGILRQQEMMDHARKKDSYDLDFLESIQNDYYLDGNGKNRTRRLKEYKKYLDNRPQYMYDHVTEEVSPEERARLKNSR